MGVPRIVFSGGEWVTVELPPLDPCWLTSDTWYYSTMYAASMKKGFDSARSSILAEVAVNKRIYPELMYSFAIEQDLASIYD